MYDRLWAPHGLVRYGVAPDHPEVKVCTILTATTRDSPRLELYAQI
jgi:adrenodoxin-NADP+ reductase